MSGLIRAVAASLIVLTSGVTAPEVWFQKGALAAAGQTPDAIRQIDASAHATATTVSRFLLDSRVERERHAFPHVLVPRSIATSSHGVSRSVQRESHRRPDLFVLNLVRVRAPPPVASLNS